MSKCRGRAGVNDKDYKNVQHVTLGVPFENLSRSI